ncbi:MAG: hypothetical protein MJY85_07260 [Fibrobacter sp.]|nr:hypothetical protein [Fibrobacter sp.]
MKTFGNIIDERDGHSYRTVQVGEQTWMADDLLYRVKNSNFMSNTCLTDPLATPSLGYRHWSDVMDSVYQGGCGNGVLCSVKEPHRGICPEGWHIPSKSDWDELWETVGKKTEAILPKAKNGTDEYGLRLYDNYYYSSTETSETRMYYLIFYTYGATVDTFWKDGQFPGPPVRCLKDYMP